MQQGDIAILRTLGANNGFIKQIFIWYGLLAMKGCLIGIVLGVITCTESHADYSGHRDITR